MEIEDKKLNESDRLITVIYERVEMYVRRVTFWFLLSFDQYQTD